MFLFHWKEESQHAIIDELEWQRENQKLQSKEVRDAAVDDLIALVVGVDGILQGQAKADAAYFLKEIAIQSEDPRAAEIKASILKAYRWQYIVSGVIEPRFQKLLTEMLTSTQMERIQNALAPLTYAVPS